MKTKFGFGLDRFSGIYLGVLFVIVFGFWSPDTFLTADTLHLIASQQAVAGMVAVALLIPMVCGQFDLSVGFTANLCGLIAVVVQNDNGVPAIWAILIAVLVGAVIGFVNGLVVVVFGVNSFIATLGMGSVLLAVQSIVTNSETPLPVASTFFSDISQHPLFGFQFVIVYLAVIALVVWWVLAMTPVGRYMYATGSNPIAAKLAGIQTARWSWISLIASSTISAFAGVLYVSLTGPSLSFNQTLLLPAFAAVFLGSTQLRPGRFNVWGRCWQSWSSLSGFKDFSWCQASNGYRTC
ncbi:ABC transporter permease [Aeromicrobium sp. UC242_57]|uniref:ABC transporter permease n=1 Tax=Aeromicrobium sp. UC242_57 TaxID=3374624 RepID=UPI00378CF41A